jgi:hypothetical protein
VWAAWRRRSCACAFAVALGCSTGEKTSGGGLSGFPSPSTESGGEIDTEGSEASTAAPPGGSTADDIASTTTGRDATSTSTTSGSADSGSTGALDRGPVGFDEDPGWIAYNLPLDGNDYGWRATAFAGGAAGEIGGHFQRPAETSFYAHVDIAVDSEAVIEASGRFNVVEVEDSYNFNTFIGHFVVAEPDGGRLGVEILEPGDGAARIRLVHGASSFDVFDLQELGIDRDWSYAYDPSVGAYGQIVISLVGQGSESYDLTADDRASIAGLDAFGMLTRQNADVATYPGLLEAYFDDIDYTR